MQSYSLVGLWPLRILQLQHTFKCRYIINILQVPAIDALDALNEHPLYIDC